jgi:hypothetical protein
MLGIYLLLDSLPLFLEKVCLDIAFLSIHYSLRRHGSSQKYVIVVGKRNHCAILGGMEKHIFLLTYQFAMEIGFYMSCG